ncbi:MAG: hypothetical protein Q8L52_00370 [bacterium]|nr:hypothetical protein [bacterium]
MFLAQLRRMGIPLNGVPSPRFIVIVMIVGTLFPDIPFWESLPLMALAFIQNAAYSLQSRAGNRTSNLYHFIAAVFATTVFFISLAYLIHLKVTLHVLLVYILGTMLGSVYGTKMSAQIERAIGAVAELGQEKKGQALQLSKATMGLFILFVLQMLFIREFDIAAMFGIALAALVANILFAILRIVRNTDAYWSHLGFVLVHATAGFVTYQFLVEVNNWALFTPYLIGSVLGSLIGAEWGKRFGSFIKAQWDVHSVPPDKMPTPHLQGVVCAALLIPHVWYFGMSEWFSEVLMLGAALLQTSAFTVVSRARQRNHEIYLEWASVFSNGIWFITLNILVVHHLAWHLWIPYLVGTGIGSLWGQAFAMRLEAEIGATMADKSV